MKKTNRLIYSVVGLFFILHCTFSILYSFPQLIKNPYLQKSTALYIYPLFNQNWKIFAPEPPVYSKSLKYRCYKTNSGWSEWIDPGEELLKKHHTYRFSHHRKLYGIYESIIRNLDGIEVDRKDKAEYVNAQNYVLDHASTIYFKKEINAIQLELVFIKAHARDKDDFKFKIFSPVFF